MRFSGVGCAVLLACTCCFFAGAQVRKAGRVSSSASVNVAVDVPGLGFISASSGKELRPLWGHLSAAGLGPSVALPAGVKQVLVSPSQNTALVAAGSGWYVLSLPSGGMKPLMTGEHQADVAAISNSGTKAVLHSSGDHTAFVYRGLPEVPERVFSADTSAFRSPVIAAAVSDDGEIAVLSTSDRGNGALYLIRKGGSPVEVAQAGRISAVRILPDGRNAVGADQVWDRLILLPLEGNSVPKTLAGPSAGVNGPTDLAIDQTRGRIYVANAKSRNIAMLSLDGALLGAFDCSFEPSRVAAFPRAGLIAVSSGESGSVWVIRPDAAESAMSFVPVLE